jgi:hypothetical protein
MNEGRQYQIGERISCACGAAYEFGAEGRRIVKKDDARCWYCLTVLVVWPQEVVWQVIEWPYAMRKIGSNDA